MKNIKFLALAVLSVLFLASCDKDDDAIKEGTEVTVTNTLQADAITEGKEVAIETLFGAPEGSLAATATVSDAVEFPAFIGLYNINISEEEINFEMSAKADDPQYKDFFRTIEANTYDRYYFTFADEVNVEEYTTNNASVKLRKDSDKVLVVEISEGYEFQPGANFTIKLED